MKESIQKTKQLARAIQESGRNQRVGFVDNRRSNTLQKVIQGDFINSINSAARYPHLHTEHQYMCYTYTPGRGNHVIIRTNGGNVRESWLHDVGEAVPGDWDAERQADHQAILDWIRANEPNAWDARWHY